MKHLTPEQAKIVRAAYDVACEAVWRLRGRVWLAGNDESRVCAEVRVEHASWHLWCDGERTTADCEFWRYQAPPGVVRGYAVTPVGIAEWTGVAEWSTVAIVEALS